jgi:hypothetical protein
MCTDTQQSLRLVHNYLFPHFLNCITSTCLFNCYYIVDCFRGTFIVFLDFFSALLHCWPSVNQHKHFFYVTLQERSSQFHQTVTDFFSNTRNYFSLIKGVTRRHPFKLMFIACLPYNCFWRFFTVKSRTETLRCFGTREIILNHKSQVFCLFNNPRN